MANDTIRFWKEGDKWGELSNFYPLDKPLVYDGKQYKTSEHLYQSLKFIHPWSTKYDLEYAELVRQTKTPYMSKLLAGQSKCDKPWASRINSLITKYNGLAKMRSDWDNIKDSVMLLVVRLKFSQNQHCNQVLKDTQEALLEENSPYDFYWGIGRDGTGLNVLGKTLVQVRDQLTRISLFGNDILMDFEFSMIDEFIKINKMCSSCGNLLRLKGITRENSGKPYYCRCCCYDPPDEDGYCGYCSSCVKEIPFSTLDNALDELKTIVYRMNSMID